MREHDNKIIPTFKLGAEYLGACSVCACDSKLMHAWFRIARSARLGSEMYPLGTHRVGVIEGCTGVVHVAQLFSCMEGFLTLEGCRLMQKVCLHPLL